MKYAEARPHIQSGDLLFWRGTGFVAALVRWATRRPWAHVAMAWRDGDQILILDAYPFNGVSIRTRLSGSLPATWVSMPLDWEAAWEDARMDIGESYSAENGVLAWLKRRLRGRGKQCAQFAIEVLKAGGVDLACEATPGAVYEAAQYIALPVVLEP